MSSIFPAPCPRAPEASLSSPQTTARWAPSLWNHSDHFKETEPPFLFLPFSTFSKKVPANSGTFPAVWLLLYFLSPSPGLRGIILVLADGHYIMWTWTFKLLNIWFVLRMFQLCDFETGLKSTRDIQLMMWGDQDCKQTIFYNCFSFITYWRENNRSRDK